MEKVDLPTVETCLISDTKLEAVQCVASAVKWLLDQMPLVPCTIFGRISYRKTSCVWHRFFKEHQAPLPFVNSEALGKYINKVWISPLLFIACYWNFSFLLAGNYPLRRKKANTHFSIGWTRHLSFRHPRGQLPLQCHGFYPSTYLHHWLSAHQRAPQAFPDIWMFQHIQVRCRRWSLPWLSDDWSF